MFKNLFLALSLVALPVTLHAQEQVPAAPEEAENTSVGFSPAAMQEWQAIEKELAAIENDPDKLLAALNSNLEKELLQETKQLILAVKNQVLCKMLDDIFRTAETEADILKAKSIVTELVSMIPDEAERQAALAEIEQQFADPATMLQQVLQARAEQQAAESAPKEEEAEAPAPTEEDYARIAEIRSELESINNSDDQLEYLFMLRNQESAAVKSWLEPQMVQILIDEMDRVQASGINTVDDLLKIKAVNAKLIRYCYPEAEKAAAMEALEAQFADVDALLKQIKEAEENAAANEVDSYDEESEEEEEEDYPVEV